MEKCGKKIFSPAEYRSPEGGPMQAIMKVDFDRRQKYENAYGYAFLSFLAVLLFVFLSTMLEEWKLIYRVSLFITQYDQLDNVLYGSDVKDRLHKPILVAVNILRFLLWVLLLYSGIIFLTSGTDYVGLIFDAVSLVFIIQLDELLYSALLRGPMKEDHGDSPPCHIHRYRLPISVLAAEFLMVVFLMVAAVWIAFMNRTEKLGPLSEALNCVCLIDGGRCDEAIVYSPAWWTDYWGKVLPASSAEIDRMMHTEMTWSVSGN